MRYQPDDGLTPEEAAVYDALTKNENESAIEVMGHGQRPAAGEMVKTIRERSSVDNVLAAMRRDVRSAASRRTSRTTPASS